MKKQFSKSEKQSAKSRFNYCRRCYQHLAGQVGVTISEAMEVHGYLKKSEAIYLVTEKGWDWFSQFEISENDFKKSSRPLTRQCIDVSERRPHLAGHLGAVFLGKMIADGWFKKVESSRELIVTQKGRQLLNETLGLAL